MPTVVANGIAIHYERAGEGPRLLFCNGTGATLATSGLLLDVFRARFDVAAHDQRGLGRTEIPPGPYAMADYADDALALADALEWDTFRLAGISFGGMVAQELAVTRPDRVERLALLCTSAGGEAGSSYPLQDLKELLPAERAETAVRLLDTRFTPEWLAGHPGDRALVEMFAGRARAESSSEARRGELAQVDARSHHDVAARLGRITCPTLVASGRYDGIAPLPNSEAIAARIAGSELRVYEGGHAFVAQDPAAFPEILDFLAAG